MHCHLSFHWMVGYRPMYWKKNPILPKRLNAHDSIHIRHQTTSPCRCYPRCTCLLRWEFAAVSALGLLASPGEQSQVLSFIRGQLWPEVGDREVAKQLCSWGRLARARFGAEDLAQEGVQAAGEGHWHTVCPGDITGFCGDVTSPTLATFDP